MTTTSLPARARCLGFILFTLVLAACDRVEDEMPVPQERAVTVYTVEEAPLMLTARLPGRTVAHRVAEVRPQVSGIVQSRLFEEGSAVTAGQPLYQIDPAPYEAALARAQAQLATSESLYRRYKSLLEQKVIPQQQFDDAEAAWVEAKAALKVAEIDMTYTRVLSPISGRIGRSRVTEGALVSSAQTQEMAIVTQLDPIFVDMTQPVSRILHWRQALEAGLIEAAAGDQGKARVRLVLEDGSVYPREGVLMFSEVNVDSGTGSVTVRAQFPNPDGKLLPGMFVHAELQEGMLQRAKLLPQQAVLRNASGQASVWVVAADGTAQRRPVDARRMLGNTWLVGDGVAAGDQVVVEGLFSLRPGTPVRAEPATGLDLVTDYTRGASQEGS